MLIHLIDRYAAEKGLTRKEMAELLTDAGWATSVTRLSTLKSDANRGKSRDWRPKEIRAVQVVTKYPQHECEFWAGKLSLAIEQLDLDDILADDIEAGLAMFALAIGKPGAGPKLTAELHDRAKRQFGLDRPLTAQEILTGGPAPSPEEIRLKFYEPIA